MRFVSFLEKSLKLITVMVELEKPIDIRWKLIGVHLEIMDLHEKNNVVKIYIAAYGTHAYSDSKRLCCTKLLG